MANLQSEINKLKRERNRLKVLAAKRKIQELKMISAINEQRKLRKEIQKLKSETKPINKILRNISRKYKRANTPQNREKLRNAYKSFKKFANKYGE